MGDTAFLLHFGEKCHPLYAKTAIFFNFWRIMNKINIKKRLIYLIIETPPQYQAFKGSSISATCFSIL